MASVECRGLGFEHGNGRTILSGFDISFEGDEGLVCVLGPNGVGKTTLARCLCGLLRPTQGTVLIDGEDAASMSRRRIAEKISFVPSSGEAPHASVRDAVLMGRSRGLGLRTSKADASIAGDAMEALGVSDLADRFLDELSAGQLQRVLIARGLAQDAEVVVLDEPTSNLDLGSQMYTASLLREIARGEGRLAIMVCHDVNLASKYADLVLTVAPPGRPGPFGTPSDVITRDCIREIYGVDCDIVEHEGRPAVLLRGIALRGCSRGSASA